MMNIYPGDVEGAPHIQPVGRADDPFIPKAQHLAASDEIEPAFGGAANLRIGFAKIPNVLVGRYGTYRMIEEDSRILSHRNQLQPFHRLKVDPQSELGEVIRIVYGSKLEPILTFHSVSKLSAELNPPR